METTHAKAGRPRSEEARTAVLYAVDDLLLEVGYGAMTMKGIAERAGVGRQTVYRWWSTKAEILLEASVLDARDELAVDVTGSPLDDLATYLDTLVRFLARSPAGAAYRALLGEAQHDPAVARLLATSDPLGDSARAVLGAVLPAGAPGNAGPSAVDRAADPAVDRAVDLAVARLVGPVLFWVLGGRDPDGLPTRELAAAFLGAGGG